MHHDGYGSMWPMAAMMGGWLLLTLLLIALVVWTVMRATARPGAAPDAGADGTADARRILADRRARGDLDVDEYDRRLAALTVPGRPGTRGRV